MRIYPTTLALLLAGAMTAACTTSAASPDAIAAASPSPLPASATPASTATPLPSATPTIPPTPTPSATPTVTPQPTPSPTPAPRLIQLTEGGCCAQPAFSPDSQQVLFIDKPATAAPVGVYGVNLSEPLPAHPTLIEPVIGFRSPDRAVVATMAGDMASFSNELTGESWQVDTGGNWPEFSPDGRRIAWVATDREGPYDQRRSDIWLANLDGSNARRIFVLYGGGLAGWFPDSERLLLLGRNNPADEEQNLISYHPGRDETTLLASHKRIRGIELSPGGSWVVFYLDFAEDEPANRGVWLLASDGASRRKLNVPGFGAYRWRNDNTLLFIPMRASAGESMQLWAVDVTTDQAAPLTDPDSLSFSISNGDWDVSPNGQTVIFVNSADQNIWAIQLP